MKKSLSLFPLLIAFFLASLLLIPSACADEDTVISVQFQSLGLTTQNFIVFDDSGDDVAHSNTTSTIALDLNQSKFYTIQMQPSVTNVEPTIWYQNILNFITDNYIAIFLLVALIVVITRK